MKLKLSIAFCIICITRIFASDPYDRFLSYKEYYTTLPLPLFVCVLTETEKANVDLGIMLAISNRESGFKNIIGYTGNDIGYFQINKAQVGKNELFTDYLDMKKNVKKAIKIYLSALKKSKGDVRKALARYNAGENYNLDNYTHWVEYVDYILKNYNASKLIVNRKITIE